VDVRIGVTYSAKEIDIELGDDADRAELRSRIDEALADDDRVLWLTDRRGRDVGIPSGKIAYIEIGSSDMERRIGFGS
jgi:hypothetical protein